MTTVHARKQLPEDFQRLSHEITLGTARMGRSRVSGSRRVPREFLEASRPEIRFPRHRLGETAGNRHINS